MIRETVARQPQFRSQRSPLRQCQRLAEPALQRLQISVVKVPSLRPMIEASMVATLVWASEGMRGPGRQARRGPRTMHHINLEYDGGGLTRTGGRGAAVTRPSS